LGFGFRVSGFGVGAYVHVRVGEVDLAVAELRDVVEADAEPHARQDPVAVLVLGGFRFDVQGSGCRVES